MSRIIIISANTSAPGAEVVGPLRDAVAMGITEAGRALVGEIPLVDVVLFENDHHEVAARIRRPCRSLEALERPYRIYELAPEESWASMDASLRELLEVTPSALEHILERLASRPA
ncbi:MAG: hypothetical protein JJ863_02855 [Deltaproteobacteria bacterium]|nr:hypothetical protein [Deltaproteobacteria bacterium]